ncbi:hypothetical protein GGR57DRAFT_140283 [Xylariaceae sp. FL1272]|nr:hypothetical protein GGR57DRAFT_140283 [Xylariaceae sp. FL1272]
MESVKKGKTLIPTPKWFIGIRVAQIVISLIAVALAGFFIHGYYADCLGFAIVSGLFTWIIAVYAILSEHNAACRSAYNTWATLSLDFVMIIFWLASLGANAAFRAAFTTSVTASCTDDGSAINAGHCTVYKRYAVANQAGLGALSGVAGVSAIMLLLFITTFAYVAHFFRLEWQRHSSDNDAEKATGIAASTPAATLSPEQSQQSQPFLNQQPTGYAPHGQQAPPYDAYMQNTGYAGAQGIYGQNVPQQPHSHQGTPAPGQPYYPPQ